MQLSHQPMTGDLTGLGGIDGHPWMGLQRQEGLSGAGTGAYSVTVRYGMMTYGSYQQS